MNVIVLILNMMINCLSLFLTRYWRGNVRRWKKMRTITFPLASYANNEAQMNQVMASWIILLWNETSKFISSTRFQLVPLEKNPSSTDSYKKLICRRVQVKTDELNDMTQKCLLRLMHHVQIQIPKQTAEDFIELCSLIFAVLPLRIISLMRIYTIRSSRTLWME